MLTPEEEETPGTALSRPSLSRDISPYGEARLSARQCPLSAGSLRCSPPWFWLTALEGICLR
jgi:hypothetical protein